MADSVKMTVDEALAKLKSGNEAYLAGAAYSGNVSDEIRRDTSKNGQFPYAVIVTCADSRVIPETMFDAGIGELFVIRVAGNVIGETQLGSVEYATGHLGTRLVVVMGHTHCGAVGAAMQPGDNNGHIQCLIDEIREAIKGESDDRAASILNVLHSVKKIEDGLGIQAGAKDGIKVVGALYDIESGRVEFL